MKPTKFETIKFEQLSFCHDDSYVVLNNSDFEMPMNEFVWVKAEEGAGKSSLLQIIAGLQIPQSGRYLINGENILEMSFEDFLPYRLQIGYSFDYGGLLNNKSLLDNLTLPLLYHKLVSEAEAVERAESLLKKFEIIKYSKDRPAHVPGRVRKIACLLRAFITYPQVLLLDDPSVGIGQDSVHTLIDCIHELRKAGSLRHIFISSYDEKLMNLVEHKVIHLNDGQLYLQEPDAEKRAVHL